MENYKTNPHSLKFSKDGFTLALQQGQSNLSFELRYVIENIVKSISIDNSLFSELSFLDKLNFIEELFLFNTSKNINGIYFLHKLRKLTINSNTNKIIFENFPLLYYISIDWNGNKVSLSKNTKLRELLIWKFKPLTKNFIDLQLPNSIDYIHITETNIESCEGLIDTELNKFEAYYCNKLTTLKGLKVVKSTLKIVQIENAKNLIDFDELWECENLERLILTNCGKIPSLKALSNLKKLKMFTFNRTFIEDGDLTPLKNIEYVFFKNEKHYNLKLKEFNIKN